ncbi:MAG TPA: M1 family aminopeptidase [Chitinophagaceae bacterium]|nr:M1 family aminopeptidase [Chitinophagaceae bacterium]
MPRYFILLTALYLSLHVAAQSNIIDVLHYKYEIELNDQNDTIYGKATIRFVIKEREEKIPLNLAIFDLKNRNADGTGMRIIKVEKSSLSENPFAPVFRFDLGHDKLAMHFSEKVKVGDTAWTTIYYKGIPSDGLIISKNKYGHRTFFADNWPNRAHNWIPCVDDPADKASVEFIVTAPSHYQVVSNGIQTEETILPGNKKLTHYKENVPLPTKVMVIAVADFAVDKVGNVGSVPVYSWVFPENKKEGFYDYALAKDILAFFINYIGPYPYKKLANVQSKTIFGGMENAGAIFYSESSVTGDRSEEPLLAHEIVHQWFGDMATEKTFAHLWLSEGFATYFAHVYMEKKYGQERFNNEMKTDRDKIIGFVKRSRKPVVDSVSPYMDLLNANSYEKGSWVLHMLRRQLGDTVFKKSIRKYYETFAGKNAGTRDLQKIFESVSGKSLEKFFTQWLYTPENLQLDIRWKYNKKEKNIAVTVKQLQPSGNFEFPLEILVQESTTSMPKRMTMMISKHSETFLFPVQSKPIRVEVDPNVSLLFEGRMKEMK